MYLLDKVSKITVIFEISTKIALPRKVMLPLPKLETRIGMSVKLYGGRRKVDKQGSN